MSNIVIKPKSATYTFNKSKFIAFVYHVPDLASINHYLTEIRKDYHDARHIVYAYRLTDQIMKCDEDGEPSNTCGKPILSLLVQQDYIQTLVIVVRYFGGILLGTGNLKRAYLEPVFTCLQDNYEVYIPLYRYQVTIPYNDLGYFNNWCHITHTKVLDQQYIEQGVMLVYETPITQPESLFPGSISLDDK